MHRTCLFYLSVQSMLKESPPFLLSLSVGPDLHAVTPVLPLDAHGPALQAYLLLTAPYKRLVPPLTRWLILSPGTPKSCWAGKSVPGAPLSTRHLGLSTVPRSAPCAKQRCSQASPPLLSAFLNSYLKSDSMLQHTASAGKLCAAAILLGGPKRTSSGSGPLL